MPVIFDDEARERVRVSLLENGLQMIKRYGMKKASIEELAKLSGIAKGTFYNFFPSKEVFVAEIILYKRSQVKKEFARLIGDKGYLNRDDVQSFIERMINSEDNIYAYLSNEDLAILSARASQSITPREEDVEATTTMILKYIPDKKEDCDWRIVANYIKMLALIMMSKDQLIEKVLHENIKEIIQLALNAIFGDSKH